MDLSTIGGALGSSALSLIGQDYERRQQDATNAHRIQTMVADYQAAGLNPMLAYGATPPQSASASGQTDIAGDAARLESSAAAKQQADQQSDLVKAQTQTQHASAQQAEASARNQDSQAALNAATAIKVQADTVNSQNSARGWELTQSKLQADIDSLRQQIKESQTRQPNIKAQTKQTQEQTRKTAAEVDLTKQKSNLAALEELERSYALRKQKREANFYQGDAGGVAVAMDKLISPLVSSAAAGLGAASNAKKAFGSTTTTTEIRGANPLFDKSISTTRK